MLRFTSFLYRVLSSRWFFVAIVVALVLQAVWFALTAAYPMAFDENYHFGIIKIYAHQWLPFISSPPAGSANLGDITRYDSYLYHYLMSFPYRLFVLFTHNQTTQIILLRLVNVALFATGFVLFRRLLLRLGMSRPLTHALLALICLIPVVPFLAATINYDNLTFLMVPVVVGFALSSVRAVHTGKGLAAPLLLLIITGGLASLVKYAFAPIFAAAFIYVIIVMVRHRQSRPFHTFLQSFARLAVVAKIGLIVGIVVAGGLLIERYGVNIVEYHTYEPDCARVLSVASCEQYGPWARNYNHQQLVAATHPAYDPTPILFVPAWIGGMVLRLFFAINASDANAWPLPIPIALMSLLALFGLIFGLKYWRQIAKQFPDLRLVFAVSVLYILILFANNLSDYTTYRVMFAINGRYLILVLPFLAILGALGLQYALRRRLAGRTRMVLAFTSLIVIVLMLQGGGMLTYLVQSQAVPGWYLPGTSGPSLEAQKIIAPLIVAGKGY